MDEHLAMTDKVFMAVGMTVALCVAVSPDWFFRIITLGRRGTDGIRRWRVRLLRSIAAVVVLSSLIDLVLNW